MDTRWTLSSGGAALASTAAFRSPWAGLVTAGLSWALKRWLTPKKARRRAAPRRSPRNDVPVWGYVIPWRGETWHPGYVGLVRTPRTPKDRWRDEDHELMAATYDLDYSRAWVDIVGQSWAEARRWEDAQIATYVEAGAMLLNKQGNPRPRRPRKWTA